MSESISYRLALDNAQYLSGMRAAQKEVRDLAANTRSANLGSLSGELQLASGSLSTFTARTGEAESRITRLIASFRSGTGSLAGLSAGFAGAAAPITAFIGSLKISQAVLESYAGYDGLVRGLKTLELTASATQNRIEVLRDVAKSPGLGFEEAIRADIRLRAVGISAELSERSLRAFGNALATVGGGKAELDGVILALGQIAAKGKVSAEEINQIAERVPQVRSAMKAAFGTADTEALGKAGVEATEFISGLVAELAKLPQVTGGARNELDNYADAWSQLKTEVTATGVEIAGGWLNATTGAINQARKDLLALKNLFGGGDISERDGGAIAREKIRDQQRQQNRDMQAEQAAAAEAAEKARVDAHNAAQERMMQAESDRAEKERYLARQREETERAALARVAKAREEFYAATDTPEQNLQRRIAALQAQGPSGQAAVDAIGDPSLKAQIYERTLQIRSLEKELADLQATAAEQARSEAEAAERKAEAEERAAKARSDAAATYSRENAILEARAAGDSRRVQQLEREAAIAAVKAELIRDQGLAEATAQAAAERRVALQEAVAKREENPGRIRLRNAEDSEQARLARMSEADKARAARWAGMDAANAAAGQAVDANKPAPPKDQGEVIARKLDKLDAIHETIANFAKA